MSKEQIKIIVSEFEGQYLIYIENLMGDQILLDDEAHSEIRQESEAKARANALRVTLAAEVIWK